MMARYSLFGAHLVELDELRNVKPATLYDSQERQRGFFYNLRDIPGMRMGRSGLASALSGLCCPPGR